MNDVLVPHPKLRIILHRCTEADSEAISNWCDVFMAGDYFVRKGHMLNLVRNPVIRVCAVIIDESIAGFVAVYKDTTLQNLLIDPQYRGQGVGAALIAVLKPTVVRCKSNMLAGDPTGFYEKNGYQVVAPDPARPHITVMTNDPARVPALATEIDKAAKNKARMNELRAIQKAKRVAAQADAVQLLLQQRGVVMPAAPPPAIESNAPPPAPTPALAAIAGTPTPPVAQGRKHSYMPAARPPAAQSPIGSGNRPGGEPAPFASSRWR